MVLDTCFSGGFATLEKGIEESPTDQRDSAADSVRFDFLDAELTRLKDIGQSNTALLSASSKGEYSLVRPDGALSVMTFHLIDGLLTAKGPVDLTSLYKRTEKGMQAYFRSAEFATGNQQLQTAGHR